MVAAMAEHYRKTRRFDTGFLGTAILCDVLFAHGYGDVIHSIMENDVMGTFLYQKRLGATTIWEYWHGGSNNHPMFGGCATVIVNYLLGIRPKDDISTYQDVVIAPVTPLGMKYAQGSIDTPWGTIASGWKRESEYITFEMTVPAEVSAVFYYKEHRQRLKTGIHRIVLED